MIYNILRTYRANIQPAWNRYAQSQNFSYKFTSQKDAEQGDGNIQPTVIEISKAEYQAMKKFVQDMRNANPGNIASITPPSTISTPARQQSTSPQSCSSSPSPYFNSQEHKLSFKLLALHSAQQFVSIMQQYKSSPSLSMKLMILHRYCGVGGTIGVRKGKGMGFDILGKSGPALANQYLTDLLSGAKKMKENQLQQVLELYLSREEEARTNAEGEGDSIPYLDLGEVNMPLIEEPSHTNSRILVLLLRFCEIQMNHSTRQGKQIQRRAIYKQIMQWYKLTTELSPQQQPYPMQQLSFIATLGFATNTPNTSILILQNQLSTSSASTSSEKKQLVRSLQIFMQGCEKVSELSEDMKKHMEELVELFLKGLSAGKGKVKGIDDGERTEVKLYGIQASTGELSALLHSCLLTIVDHPSAPITQMMAIPILNYLMNNPASINNLISLPQYSEYWSACMIIYKLLKSKSAQPPTLSQTITQQKLQMLVNTFINKANIQTWLKDMIREDNGAVLQEVALEGQRMLFQSLVAYRMVLPTQIQTNSHQTHPHQTHPQQTHPHQMGESGLSNLQKQTGGDSSRAVLRSLLGAYRQTMETLHKTPLLTATHTHNLIIVCMIAQAYPLAINDYQNWMKAQKKEQIQQRRNHGDLLMSKEILQILREEGINHEKYGAFVQRLLSTQRIISMENT